MPTIQLTQGKETIVSEEDFALLKQWQWCVLAGYAGRGKGIYMHRVIMEHMLNMAIPGGYMVDHTNREKLDNRRANLRLARGQENLTNSRKRRGATSQFKGVTWDDGRGNWRAGVQKNGTRYYLGNFINEEDAARAYDAKATELFGEYAGLNFQGDGKQRLQVSPPNPRDALCPKCPECGRGMKKATGGWVCPKAVEDFPIDNNGRQYTRLSATHKEVRIWTDKEMREG